ncbi:hypothetical protein ACI782_15940 [Geodermatophilus sp. SYSU D00703]
MGEQLGTNSDTLRHWARQARVDAGAEPGLTSDERTRLRELQREVRELRRAKRSSRVHRLEFGVEPICRVPREHGLRSPPEHLPGGQNPPPSARAQRDAVVSERIRAVHGDREIGRGLYGMRKVHAQLRPEGGVNSRPVSRRQAEHLMRADGQ